MATAKQLVLDLLESLPDDCSLEDITYELYVRQAIAQGEQEADTGRLVPHDEVMRQARKCLER
jgi:predicted transcriptional regulator